MNIETKKKFTEIINDGSIRSFFSNLQKVQFITHGRFVFDGLYDGCCGIITSTIFTEDMVWHDVFFFDLNEIVKSVPYCSLRLEILGGES